MQSEIGSVQQELIWNGLESCNNLPLLTASLGEGVIAGEVSALDTPHCGRSSLTEQLPLFSDDAFRHVGSLKQTLRNFQTNSSPLSLFRRFISSARLAPTKNSDILTAALNQSTFEKRDINVDEAALHMSGSVVTPISQMQAKDPGLQELVAACFLRDSDHCDYSKFRTLFLRMSKASSAVAPTQPQNRQLELFSDTKLEDGVTMNPDILTAPSSTLMSRLPIVDWFKGAVKMSEFFVGESQRKHVLSRNQLRNSIRDRISSGYSGSLAHWGIVAPGRSETAGDGFPKTDPESSLLVVTGNIQCRKIEPGRPTLQDCLDSDAVAINSASFESIDESFTLRPNLGRNGNPHHPVPYVLDQHPQGDLASHIYLPSADRLNREETPALTSPCGTYPFAFVGSPSNGWQPTSESPALTSSGWLHSPSAETQKSVLRFAVMYRSATGSRLYTEESPTLRSLANTGGKHQGGGGAWKVVEYKGEEYVVPNSLPDECSTLAATEAYIKSGDRPRRVKDGKPSLIPMAYRRQRPLSATEFERLMGWPVDSTKKGITASGKEITISKTQRQKMLGNGIIPQEIQDICLSLKPFLESWYHQPEALEPGEELSNSSDFQQT